MGFLLGSPVPAYARRVRRKPGVGGYAMSFDSRHPALVLAGVLSMALLGLSTVVAEAQNTVTYECRWDKVAGAGGAWSTGWVTGHVTPYCGASAINRVSPAGDFSAAQRSGSQISYGPRDVPVRCEPYSAPVGLVEIGSKKRARSRTDAEPPLHSFVRADATLASVAPTIEAVR